MVRSLLAFSLLSFVTLAFAGSAAAADADPADVPEASCPKSEAAQEKTAVADPVKSSRRPGATAPVRGHEANGSRTPRWHSLLPGMLR